MPIQPEEENKSDEMPLPKKMSSKKPARSIQSADFKATDLKKSNEPTATNEVAVSEKRQASSISESSEAPIATSPSFKKRVRRLAYGLLAALVVTLIVFGVLIYGYHSDSAAVYDAAKIVPYPVASVNSHLVRYSDYLFQLNANKRGYAQNAKLNNQTVVDYNSAAGKKLTKQFESSSLTKIKTDAIVAQLAAARKISVTNGDVTVLINQLYSNYGGKATLLKTLNDIYGWNLADLRSVVYKQLLEQKLSTSVTSDAAADQQAKAKAQAIEAKIAAGGDFAALAKQYSQAADAASGGSLGSFTKGQVSTQIQTAVDSLAVGAVSAPVKDQYGYEIIKVTEKNGNEAQASHILIKTIDFTDYLNSQVSHAKYHQYIKV